jgi:GNAT superfamily N-acetyltransferase
MLTVREATKNDIDIIFELIIAFARHQNLEKFLETNKDEMLKSGFGSSAKFGFLLAEIDDRAIGFVSYVWSYSIWLGADYMLIDDLYVLPDFRGEKAGEALMLKANQLCKLRGVKRLKWEVQQDNQQAIKFYKRLGAQVDIKGICRWQTK